jgi:metal-responsive CopG/Arc/MetJ family transcriptional regulator
VRLTTDELAALEAKARHENVNRSEAIRKALDAWVSVA